ncbi:MAG: FecR domain-containing protein [Gemmatimonadaceae bacterium]
MRPDEFLTSGGEVQEMSSRELEEARAEDPEIGLITDYLTGSLTPDDARAVEARLRDDAPFAERVGVIVTAWDAWPSWRDVALPEEELAVEARRFRLAGERLLRSGSAEQRDTDADDRPRARGQEGVDHAAMREMQRRMRRWQLAAVLIGAIVLPATTWGTARLTARLTAPRPRPEYHVMQPPGREGMPVRLGEDAMAVVEAGGRLTWNDSANVGGIRELFLEGAAQFQMRRAPVGRFVVVTPSARIIVTGSDFQVTAVDPAVTNVRVQEGTVVLEARGVSGVPLLPLGAGERAMAIWRQEPRRVY